MTGIEADVLIARPIREVFDYLMEPNHLPIWDSSILEAEKLTPGPPGIGTRWRGASKILGRRFTWVTEIQEFDAPGGASAGPSRATSASPPPTPCRPRTAGPATPTGWTPSPV